MPTRLVRRRNHEAAVGGHWEQVGRLQFGFLVGHGLTPETTLLDVACGSLRLGRLVIPYLEPGRYAGVDADRELLDAGARKVLGRRLMRERRPRLIHAAMPAPLPPADIAWCHALFDHVRPDAARTTIVHLVEAAPRVFASFFLADEPERPMLRVRNGSQDGAITT